MTYMQPITKLLSKERLILTALLAAGSAGATGFTYNTGDLLIGFRRTAGEAQVVINAGPAASYTSLTPGTVITIGKNLSAAITSGGTFADLNGVTWSAFADMVAFSGSYPYETLWLTRPCADQFTRSTPWARDSQYGQADSSSQIEGVGIGSAAYCSQNPGANFTATSVIIPITAPNSQRYSAFVDNSVGVGNFNNNFQGNVEKTTPANFVTAGQPVRSDFYLLQPGSGAGQYLGYFELSPTGVMTFTAAPLLEPFQISVDQSGNVSFPTTVGVTYRLYFSTDAQARLSTWTSIGLPILGDGSPHSVQDESFGLASAGFYRVKAQ
jgi:hypothetical protein